MVRCESHYDPSRETVGKIYRDAQIHNRVEKIECGDMGRELMKSLVDDLNESIKEGMSDPEFFGKEFYITIHEKKDAQMPNCILRRMIKTLYRPWPEDDTVVFYVHPSGEVRFCWCLPHSTEILNSIANETLYQSSEDREYINRLKAWRNVDLHCFGFIKTYEGHWIPNLNWQDQRLGEKKNQTLALLM